MKVFVTSMLSYYQIFDEGVFFFFFLSFVYTEYIMVWT